MRCAERHLTTVLLGCTVPSMSTANTRPSKADGETGQQLLTSPAAAAVEQTTVIEGRGQENAAVGPTSLMMPVQRILSPTLAGSKRVLADPLGK